MAEESRAPIHGRNNCRVLHFAVRSEERGDPDVREGLYIATLIFINSSGNWLYGSKLNSSESARRECDRGRGVSSSRSVMA